MKVRMTVIVDLDTESEECPEEFKGLPFEKLKEEMRKSFVAEMANADDLVKFEVEELYGMETFIKRG